MTFVWNTGQADYSVYTDEVFAAFQDEHIFGFGCAGAKKGTLTPRCFKKKQQKKPTQTHRPAPQRLLPILLEHKLDTIQTSYYETALAVDMEKLEKKTEANTARAENIQLTPWAASKVGRKKKKTDPKKHQNVTRERNHTSQILVFIDKYKVSKGFRWFSNQATNKDN